MITFNNLKQRKNQNSAEELAQARGSRLGERVILA